MSYVKVHGSMLDSTVWDLPDHVRLVWITMLAMKDEYGVVSASVPGLARRARVTLENTENAIEVLSAPDRYSRTKHDDGRRIEEVDGGWLVLNHDKYRELQSIEERRAKGAERARRFREREAEYRNAEALPVTHRNAPSVTRNAPSRDVTRVTPSDTDQIISEQSEEMSPPSGDDRASSVLQDRSGGDFEPLTGAESVGTENVPPTRANQLVDDVDAVPGIAVATAAMLLSYIVSNQPDSAVARMSERDRENTTEEWVKTICKMHIPGKREYVAIQSVMHWVFRDASWRLIIDSADALRLQWNAIVAHRERKTKQKNGTNRRRILPDGWRPERTPVNMAAEKEARDRGVDVGRELEQMRDWARANRETKADWEATWRNWMRNSKPANGSGGFRKPPSAGAVMMAEVERLEREERERELEHPQQLLLEEGQ